MTSPPSTSPEDAQSAPSTSILLPAPSGPLEGTTPQRSVVVDTNPSSAPPPRKARLTGPEIVQLPPDHSFDSDADTDAESEASIGEDGEPKARDMLKDLPDDTDVSSSSPFPSLPSFVHRSRIYVSALCRYIALYPDPSSPLLLLLQDLELTHLQLVNTSLPPLHLPRFGSFLKRLCLRQNRLTSLEPDIFEALTQLEDLDFYDNRINHLEGFEKLTKLKSVPPPPPSPPVAFSSLG